MNFLMLRSSNQAAINEEQSVKEAEIEPNYSSRKDATLEGLIDEQTFPEKTSSGDENGSMGDPSGKISFRVDSLINVTEDDGFIVIPNKEIPDSWTEAPDILSYRSLDRNFLFAGEQIQILACLYACKQDTEIMTPFKVAAVINKNGIGQSPPNERVETGTDPVFEAADVDAAHQNGQVLSAGEINVQNVVSTGETLLRLEDQRRQTEQLLQQFKNSHFFARIAESNELLWSERRAQETAKNVKKKNPINAVIDRGEFDACKSGGLARGVFNFCSLSNGDIVVFLQVNVEFESMRDPILEILQFEKFHERNPDLENRNILNSLKHDPSDYLLKWLLPLNNSRPSARPLPPTTLSSSSPSIRSTSTKIPVSASTSTPTTASQLFSFGNFRSYSMSSLPPNAAPPQDITIPDDKPSFEPEDWDQFSFRKFVENGKHGNEGLLSFRGVPLEPKRFSVQCGLEGIFTPGRRWRRKIELIRPVEIHSFSVECNTDDLLCVHVKNVCPANAQDVVIFIDSITIVFEEASKSGQPLALPIACTEAGNDHSLPNLALRRDEEHSFILKPATTLWKHPKDQTWSNSQPPSLSAESADQYAVLVSYRCNYTESKLFYKQPTSWRPHIPRELMISVASETSRRTIGSDGTQLPIQFLTLQASNMTSDDLTLTVLAPTSFNSPPPLVPCSNSLSSPLSPFAASAEVVEVEKGQLSVSVNERFVSITDVIPDRNLGCTHLWLQSRVPLGCVPAQSTATIKLQVFPLVDGIITLDSLQIDVKEKGLTYVPEHAPKINATTKLAKVII